MRIAVFGATGGTGKELVRQGLERGHQVTAFVRDPSKLEGADDTVSIVQGTTEDKEAIARAVAGQDAVLLALGNANRKPNTELSDGTRRIVEAMREADIKRILVVTSLACGGSMKQLKSPLFRILVKTVGKNIWADKDRQEAVVMGSGLDWIILRPGGLRDGEKTGRILAVDENADFPKKALISRADVAAFMLDQLDNDHWLGKPVSLCEAPQG